jgi:hypothetical protein
MPDYTGFVYRKKHRIVPDYEKSFPIPRPLRFSRAAKSPSRKSRVRQARTATPSRSICKKLAQQRYLLGLGKGRGARYTMK